MSATAPLTIAIVHRTPWRPPRIRDRVWSAALLDGVNAAALALMAGVTLQLGRTALVDPLTIALFVGGLLVLWRTQLNSAWLIAAGAAIGLVRTLLG